MYLDTISQIHDIIVESYHVIMFVITILDYNIIILDSGYDIIIVCNCSTHDSSCFHSSVIMYYVRLSDLPCTSTWSCPAPAELTICTINSSHKLAFANQINSSLKLAFANHWQVQFVLNHWKRLTYSKWSVHCTQKKTFQPDINHHIMSHVPKLGESAGIGWCCNASGLKLSQRCSMNWSTGSSWCVWLLWTSIWWIICLDEPNHIAGNLQHMLLLVLVSARSLCLMTCCCKTGPETSHAYWSKWA